MKLFRIVLLVLCFLYMEKITACTGGTSAGVLTPTTSYQTTNALNGNYFTISVVSCATYYFTFCSDGGSAAYDTELTLLDATGVTQLAYSDDACGLQSSISWTANATTTVRILVSRYSCNHDLGSSATLAYKYTPKVGDYCITNDAEYITVGGENCIQLTPEVNSKVGCAWNDNLIDFNNDFSLTLDYYFGNNINGADGTTFTFQPNLATACGIAGGEIGAGGISNSLVVEFDTYDNDPLVHSIDIAPDHIAIETDGSLMDGSHYAGPVAALASLANIDDGIIHEVQIAWNSTTHNLNIYFDGALRLTGNGDFVNTIFGGDNTVYWGATAATGGLNNQQYFCPNTVVFLPLELVSFKSICKEDKSFIHWITESENDVAYFQVEATTDGIIYHVVGQVNGLGDTDHTREYELEFTSEVNVMTYYRLKIFDSNGDFKTTDLIIGKYCGDQVQDLMQNYTFKDGLLNFSLLEGNVFYKVVLPTGQEIIPTQFTGNQITQNLTILNASQGIYLIYLESEDGTKKEVHRIFHSKG